MRWAAICARSIAKPNKENVVRALWFELFVQSVIEVLKGKKKVNKRKKKKASDDNNDSAYISDVMRLETQSASQSARLQTRFL